MRFKSNWLIRWQRSDFLQKLEERNTYTPLNTSLVQCNCDSELNKEETLSVQSLKTFSNNTEVNQPRCKEEQNLRVSVKVYILNKRGEPLMPCSPSKAKKLLKENKVKVVKRFPFTIQLLIGTGEIKQDVTLGIDTGYGNIGFSATTEKEELISGTLKLDLKTKDRLDEKRMYRRNRRSRHHWYRKPRFLNRGIKKGWLPPSTQRRYNTHLNLIEKLKKVLPIKNIILEIAKFDIQKLENPEIQGKEYQEGTLYDYQNIVSYLKTIQNNKCVFCDKEFKSGDSKNIHHKHKHGDSRRTDRPEGLILLHKHCHKKLHEKHLEKKFQNVKVKQYRDSTFMSIVNKKFWDDIKNLKVTYGNITYVNRNKLNLEKTHYNDAFVISGATTQKRCKPIKIIQKHRNNRKLQIQRKGFKPSIRKQHYKIQPKDLVLIGKKWIITNGCHCNGTRVYINNKDININKIKKVYNFGSFVWNLNYE